MTAKESRPGASKEHPLRLAKPKEYDAYASELSTSIRRVECGEREEHPLERVIDSVPTEDGLLISTAGIHLAPCLASRLGRRNSKRPGLHDSAEQSFVRVDFDQ